MLLADLMTEGGEDLMERMKEDSQVIFSLMALISNDWVSEMLGNILQSFLSSRFSLGILESQLVGGSNKIIFFEWQ